MLSTISKRRGDIQRRRRSATPRTNRNFTEKVEDMPMDSDEIQSLAQEETPIRFWCNHTLNRNVNNREAAYRYRTREGLDFRCSKI
jgi:hypothetical protein